MAGTHMLPKSDLPRRSRRSAQSGQSRRSRGLDRRTLASVGACLSVAVLVTAVTVTAPSAVPRESLLVGSLAALVLLCAGWFVVGRQARSARVRAGLGLIRGMRVHPTPNLTHLARTGDHVTRSGSETLALRTLRAQVRTLERALDQEQRQYAATEAAGVAAGSSFRRDVLLTVRAISGRTAPEESGRHTLARLAAAIERLDADDELARPILAPAATLLALPARPVAIGHELNAGAPSVDADPAVAVVAAAPESFDDSFEEPLAETPAEATLELPDGPVAQAVPAHPTAEELLARGEDTEAVLHAPEVPDVVLPVPPLMTQTQTQRSRRWFRRTAA